MRNSGTEEKNGGATRKRIPTIVATIPLHVLQMARRYGVDTDAILREVGLSRAQLEDPDGRVPVPAHVRFYRRVVEESGNPAIALESGLLMSPGSLKIVGYILMTSATLFEVYSNLSRYWGLLSEELSSFEVNFVEVARQERAEIDILFHGQRFHNAGREGIESMTSHCIALGRRITGQNFSALEMHYPYPEPIYANRYRELFGGRVLFDQPHTKIVLAADVVRLSTLHPDPLLATSLKEQADRSLDQLKEDRNFVRRARAAITKHLSTARFDIAAIASYMNLGERTLQRRLHENGTTFSALVSETRREQALLLLRQPDQSINEIAFLTGYSERSAFDRAFKTWTGLTPMKFRKKSAG
ncbi:MAG: AraC family transcriptional regulator [Rhodospirillales bacterium]|nr:AraC family transcriptional regulator [Rhodospirillales bacterium]MDP6646456.1 AraC family transcriptional regulator [Rhodospirillales bacterium]